MIYKLNGTFNYGTKTKQNSCDIFEKFSDMTVKNKGNVVLKQSKLKDSKDTIQKKRHNIYDEEEEEMKQTNLDYTKHDKIDQIKKEIMKNVIDKEIGINTKLAKIDDVLSNLNHEFKKYKNKIESLDKITNTEKTEIVKLKHDLKEINQIKNQIVVKQTESEQKMENLKKELITRPKQELEQEQEQEQERKQKQKQEQEQETKLTLLSDLIDKSVKFSPNYNIMLVFFVMLSIFIGGFIYYKRYR